MAAVSLAHSGYQKSRRKSSNIYMHVDLATARSSKNFLKLSKYTSPTLALRLVSSYLYTLDMFLTLVGFVVSVVDIH